MNPNPAVKIFSAEYLLPIEGDMLSPGALAVREGRILETGHPTSLMEKFPDADRREFSGKTLMPGLVNAHADLSLSCYEKFPHPPYRSENGQVHLMYWLTQLSRFKSNLALPDQREAVQKGLDEMKTSGVTTVGDQCRYPAAVPLYEGSGLRVVCLAEIENIQRPLAQAEFEQALALVDEVRHGENPRLTAGYAPFSAYALSKNLLKILTDHALQQGVPLHLFAALSFSEMEFFYDSLGEISEVLFREAGWQEKTPPPHRMTPVQYLQEIGFLRAKPTLIGCLHLGPTDSAILDNSECMRLYSPQAFHHLQVGKIRWEKIFSQKVSWALGTLGKAWGGSGHLWDEMRCVLHESEEEKRADYAADILRAATLGGARALALEQEVGSLLPGKQADFIVIDSPVGEFPMPFGILDQTRPERVVASFVAGEPVYFR